MNNIEVTLKERGSRYGSYEDVVNARVSIMLILEAHNDRADIEKLSEKMKIALGDIVLKLVRAAACPSYKDSWHDIQGYAHLIETELASKGESE